MKLELEPVSTQIFQFEHHLSNNTHVNQYTDSTIIYNSSNINNLSVQNGLRESLGIQKNYI